jgi:hypothetical protein
MTITFKNEFIKRHLVCPEMAKGREAKRARKRMLMGPRRSSPEALAHTSRSGTWLCQPFRQTIPSKSSFIFTDCRMTRVYLASLLLRCFELSSQKAKHFFFSFFRLGK